MGKMLPCHCHRHARDQILIEATVNSEVVEDLASMFAGTPLMSCSRQPFHTPRSDRFQ